MAIEAYDSPQQPHAASDEVQEFALFSGRPALGTPLMTGLLAGFFLMQLLISFVPDLGERGLAVAGLLCALASATLSSVLVRRAIPDRLRVTGRTVEMARGKRPLRSVDLTRLAEVNQVPTQNGQVLVLADHRRVMAIAQSQLADPRDYERMSQAIVERVAQLDPTGTIGPAAVRAGRLQESIAQQPVRGVVVLSAAVGLASMLAFQARDALAGRPFVEELMGAMSAPLLAGGETFRLFSYAFLHANGGHLLLSLASLLWLGGTLEKLVGWERTLIAFAAGVLGGAIGHALVQAPLAAIGSTGGLFGLIGSLAALAFFARSRVPRTMLPRPSFWIFTALLALMLPLAMPGEGSLPLFSILGERLAGPVGGGLLGFVVGTALLMGLELPAPEEARRDVRPFAILSGIALAIGLVGGVSHHRRAHPDDTEILTQAWMALPPKHKAGDQGLDKNTELQNVVAYTMATQPNATAETLDSAERIAQVAVVHSERAPHVLDTLAVARYRQGNQDEARSLLEEAIKQLEERQAKLAAPSPQLDTLKRFLERRLREVEAGADLSPDDAP